MYKEIYIGDFFESFFFKISEIKNLVPFENV
jgi:hypothetical protein